MQRPIWSSLRWPALAKASCVPPAWETGNAAVSPHPAEVLWSRTEFGFLVFLSFLNSATPAGVFSVLLRTGRSSPQPLFFESLYVNCLWKSLSQEGVETWNLLGFGQGVGIVVDNICGYKHNAFININTKFGVRWKTHDLGFNPVLHYKGTGWKPNGDRLYHMYLLLVPSSKTPKASNFGLKK